MRKPVHHNSAPSRRAHFPREGISGDSHSRENFNPIRQIELTDILDVVSSHPKPDQFSAKSVPRINIHIIYNDTILKTDLDSKGIEHTRNRPGRRCVLGWLIGDRLSFPKGMGRLFSFRDAPRSPDPIVAELPCQAAAGRH